MTMELLRKTFVQLQIQQDEDILKLKELQEGDSKTENELKEIERLEKMINLRNDWIYDTAVEIFDLIK